MFTESHQSLVFVPFSTLFTFLFLYIVEIELLNFLRDPKTLSIATKQLAYPSIGERASQNNVDIQKCCLYGSCGRFIMCLKKYE